MEKLTKKEKFEMVKDFVKDNEMLTEFINHEIELLNKKSANHTPTKNQKENESLKDLIVEALKILNKASSIKEIQAQNEVLATKTNQKISALLKQLVDTNRVERIVDKKQTLFKLV